MKKTHFKIGNLEIRTTDKSLGGTGKHSTFEIVQWNKEYCWTIAHFVKGEDFNLVFTGSRPFENTVDKDVFWELCEFGNKHLNN